MNDLGYMPERSVPLAAGFKSMDSYLLQCPGAQDLCAGWCGQLPLAVAA